MKKKRITAFILVIVLTMTAILTGLPARMFHQIHSLADGEIMPEMQTDLYFGYTCVPNQGVYNTYPRGRMKKEYLTKGTGIWADFNGYTFCMANHSGHSPTNVPATVDEVYSIEKEKRPAYEFKKPKEPMNDFDFALEVLMMYFLGKNTTNLKDPYTDAANYLIGKAIHAVNYQGGQMSGNLESDIEVFDAVLQYNIVNDFNPDINGLTAIPTMINAPTIDDQGKQTTYARAVFTRLHHAATFLSQLEGTDAGWVKRPEIMQGSDGLYHAKITYEDTEINRLYFSNLQCDKTYGDWKFVGGKAGGSSGPSGSFDNEEEEYSMTSGPGSPSGSGGSTAVIEFTSPTGAIPDEKKIADMSFKPGTEYDDILTQVSSGDLVRFKFLVNGTRKGQDQMASRLKGNFSLVIGEGPVETEASADVDVKRYKHTETFQATYNVNLIKFDSETGRPLEGAIFDILEAFDDSQLDDTESKLDVTNVNELEHTENSGELVDTQWPDDEISSNYSGDTGLLDTKRNKFNWENRKGTQFDHWEGWDEGNGELVCERDNDITGSDGYLYSNTTENVADTSRRAHTDVKSYTYEKGYCGGHPAPEIEYAECEHEEECDCDEVNQEIHEEAWEAWYKEVEICEKLAEEGGFFHAIEEGVAQKAMEEDRDQAYEDFVNLEYEYSAKEITARNGYLIHDTHTDDIPIEIRVVSSSEVKDLNKNGLKHTGGSSGNEGGEDNEDGENEDVKEYNAAYRTVRKANKAADVELKEQIATASNANINKAEDYIDKEDFFEDDGTFNEEKIDDEEPEEQLDANFVKTATASDIERTETTGGGIRRSGLSYRSIINSIMTYSEEESDDAGSSDGSGASGSVTFLESIANKIDPNKSDIIDWTFIVYDHRPEGEVHINKRDIDLKAKENDSYSAFADANGDGDLEGAVYGLFAAEDIIHPDGKTGVVYQQNDLVAISTTDRNGDSSFMSYTEKPGTTYDYENGTTIRRTDKPFDGPTNLYTNMDSSVALNENNELFVGYTKDYEEITIEEGTSDEETRYHRLSSNQEIENTKSSLTTYWCPIENNEDNNGNCWIGRSIIEGKYYVKELSRSEGYELSVYGKNALITNRDAYEAGGNTFAQGTFKVGEIYQNDDESGNIFSVTSNDVDENGYDIVISNFPKSLITKINTYTTEKENTTITTKIPITEKQRVIARTGDYVVINGKHVKANVGDAVSLPNGSSRIVNAVSDATAVYARYTPDNILTAIPPTLGSDNSLSVDQFITEINKDLAKTYSAPNAGTPYKLVPLNSALNTDRAAAITDVIKDMTVFNAIRLETITNIAGADYAVLRYSYQFNRKESDVIYDEQHDKLLVKQSVKIDGKDGFIYVPYQPEEFITSQRNDTGFLTKASVKKKKPNKTNFTTYEELDNLVYSEMIEDTYWIYAEGDILLDNDGSEVEVDVIVGYKDQDNEAIKETKVYQDFPEENYYYDEELRALVIHVDPSMIPSGGTIYFNLVYTNPNEFDLTDDNPFQYMKKYARITVSPAMKTNETYIASVHVTYQGEDTVVIDANTNNNPTRVLERPIRQRVKVVKDIQTIPNSEEYLHDTYSDVHTENLSKNESGLWYDKGKDWLFSLFGGEAEGQTASKIPEFRFKAYLKSNLERLYRDNDGNITWQDRNGNAYVPSYQDTNYDGNYDTFVWQSGTSTFDFPEKSIENGTVLESANVQKIYTKVEHNDSSTTAGDISNNVWAKYANPQTGNTTNVGEVEGFSTSQDNENGEAVNVNASLYSYDDKNTNVRQTDKINQNQNQGYTRLLETRLRTMEDGAGKTREVEEYNYEKFFDAMAAANNDKWDNDMYSSTKNYPGQHWFDTFEEHYQMDDADPDRTLANVDGVDADGTAGGDKDNSFKPFQWIREHMFGTTQDAKDDYPATHDNDNLENKINTSDIAHRNAEASNEVRQFAIKWYLDDEVGKLVTNNGYNEDVAKKGAMSYQEEVYDQALYNALEKAYNYLKPFYKYDLDTIYSVEWDSAESGGSDGDVTTLSADILYERNGTSQGESKSGYYYGVSAYLPYGTYVLVEQQPFREDLDDFDNKHYKTDMPKELILPAVYEEGGNIGSPEMFHAFYNYNTKDTPVDLAKKYMIRFNEEWAENHTDDLRNYVIRAHGYDGDYEVYKYGLDADKLVSNITYDSGQYDYNGYSITQGINDPLKDYYNDPLVDTAYEGGNANSHYFADDKNKGTLTANGTYYADNAIEKRYHFGSISENAGMAKDVLYQLGNITDDNNPSGFYFKDNVKTMTGNQTAYEGKYASMLVPWSVIEPADSAVYSVDDMTGYADRKFRNTFYQTKLRIEKVDSETGEQLLHDDAIFSIYAASRYTSRDEIEKAGAPAGTEIGDVKFYMEDTMITGSKEFLMSMGAWNIGPVMRGRAAVGMSELYTGIVAAGTPVCLEEEQIIMEDMLGNKTGQFKVYTTLNDVETIVEENAKGPEDKAYADQNTGYLVTPQPLGAGVYVIAETKAPNGYAKTRPIAVEIYSDSVSYYMNGLMDSEVESTIYQGNLMEQ